MSDYSSDALAAPKTILKLELDRTTKSTSPYYFTGEDGNEKTISDAEAKTKRNEFDSYAVVTINWIPITQGL